MYAKHRSVVRAKCEEDDSRAKQCGRATKAKWLGRDERKCRFVKKIKEETRGQRRPIIGIIPI